MTKAKDELLSFKESIGLSNGLTPTDMAPIINGAWNKSFARVGMNKNTISYQGYNPLNRAMLLNEELRVTMTMKESTAEYCSTHYIVIPKKYPPNNDSSTDTDDNSKHMLSNNPPIITDELNTADGTAGDCMKALFSSKLFQRRHAKW